MTASTKYLPARPRQQPALRTQDLFGATDAVLLLQYEVLRRYLPQWRSDRAITRLPLILEVIHFNELNKHADFFELLWKQSTDRVWSIAQSLTCRDQPSAISNYQKLVVTRTERSQRFTSRALKTNSYYPSGLITTLEGLCHWTWQKSTSSAGKC